MSSSKPITEITGIGGTQNVQRCEYKNKSGVWRDGLCFLRFGFGESGDVLFIVDCNGKRLKPSQVVDWRLLDGPASYITLALNGRKYKILNRGDRNERG